MFPTVCRRKQPRWSSARIPDRSSTRPKPSASSKSTRPNSCAARSPNPKLACDMTSFDLAIGRGTLRQLHASLANHAPDQAVTILQEAGYAAGEAIYKAFASWLPERTGVDSPGNLDADLLAETLSDFFTSGGLGAGEMSPGGAGGPALELGDRGGGGPGRAPTPT